MNDIKEMSHVMRKLSLCYMRTTKLQTILPIHAPAHPRRLIGAFVIRCLDSLIRILAKSKISRLQLASVAVQVGLCLTWSQTIKDRFSQLYHNDLASGRASREVPVLILKTENPPAPFLLPAFTYMWTVPDLQGGSLKWALKSLLKHTTFYQN